MNARALHGPLSPVGAALGILLVALPFAVGGMAAPAAFTFWLGGPVVGLGLLTFPGRARQLGIGLVASALTFPLLLLALGLASALS
ncbi:hypothetical protein GCM10027596_09280 [Nocardioides korecus]